MSRKIDRMTKKFGGPPWIDISSSIMFLTCFILLLLLSLAAPSASQASGQPGNSATTTEEKTNDSTNNNNNTNDDNSSASSSTSGHVGYPGYQPGFGNPGSRSGAPGTTRDQSESGNTGSTNRAGTSNVSSGTSGSSSATTGSTTFRGTGSAGTSNVSSGTPGSSGATTGSTTFRGTGSAGTSNGSRRTPGSSSASTGSTTLRATTSGPVHTPQNVEVEMFNTTHANVSWNTADDQNGTRYTVMVICQREMPCCIKDCNFTVETVESSTLIRVGGSSNYSISVVAETENGTSSFSISVELKTNHTEFNRTEVRVIPTNASLTWEWDYPCSYSGPVNYILEVERKRLKVDEIGECKYSASMDNLVPFHNYWYSLLAVSSDDCNATCGSITYPERSRATTEGATTEAITTDIEAETSDSKSESRESVIPSGTTQSSETSVDDALSDSNSGTYSGNTSHGETSQATPTNAAVEKPFYPQLGYGPCPKYHPDNNRFLHSGWPPKGFGSTAYYYDYGGSTGYTRYHRGKYPPPNVQDSRGSCYDCNLRCAQTKPGVPSSPTKFTAEAPIFKGSSPKSIQGTLRWEKPAHPHGELSEYHLQYFGPGGKEVNCSIPSHPGGYSDKSLGWECFINSNKNGQCNINMDINSNYTFHLRVRNTGVDEYSPTVTAGVTTSSGWPYIDDDRSNPFGIPSDAVRDKYYLYRSYPLEIFKDRFREENGPITDFKILLKTKFEYVKYQQNRAKDHLTTTINKDTTTVVYHNTTIPIFFVFGDVYESECPEGREVCNKYLESETEYFFQFLLFSHDKYTESKIYTFRTMRNHTKDVITGLIITLLLLVALTVVAFFVYKRYLDPIVKRGESMELPLLVPMTTDENLSKPIPLSEIEATVERLLANGGQALFEEYKELKSVSPSKPKEEATNGYNPSKNRYVNILPFDETRVILNEYRGSPNSDYINASYIHGFEKSKEFIACQGPRSNEVDDFWRMIWEKNVHVIVMVTKCVESNMDKCCKYWPDVSESKALTLPQSRLSVKTKVESPHPTEGYVYRQIELSKGSSLLTKRRYVKHFHYTLWPDMGCPKDPKNMIEFVTLVKKAIPDASSHTVVHCSAGVGRTGTFIALYNLMEEMKAKSSADVFQAVYKMRQNRENMVQTQDQYAFLYKCILKHHQIPKDDVEITLPDSMPDIVTNTRLANNAITGYDPYEEDPKKNKKCNGTENMYPVEEEGDILLESMSEEDYKHSMEMIPLSDEESEDEQNNDVEKDKNVNQTADKDVEKAKNMDQTVDKDVEKAKNMDQTLDKDVEKAKNMDQTVEKDVEKAKNMDQTVDKDVEKAEDSSAKN